MDTSNNTPGDQPAAAPHNDGNETVYSSSTTSSHFHTFALDDTDMITPPAAGVSGNTSTDALHAHTVTISMASLASVGAGQTVKISTSVAGGDSHVITLVKVAATAGGPDAGTGGGGGGGGGTGGGGGEGGGGGYRY